MNQVSNLSRLGETVKSFTGNTVDDAIKASETWANNNGVTLSNFFLQHKIGKSHSIIVDATIPQGDEDEMGI